MSILLSLWKKNILELVETCSALLERVETPKLCRSLLHEVGHTDTVFQVSPRSELFLYFLAGFLRTSAKLTVFFAKFVYLQIIIKENVKYESLYYNLYITYI